MTATRRQAREWAVQLLTSADLNPPDDLVEFRIKFWQQVRTLDPDDGGTGGEDVRGKLRDFTEDRFLGVQEHREELDGRLQPFLDGWEMYRLGTVERAVMRLGAWELINTTIPTPVVINEAVDLVNWYASPKSRFLVNSVLDKLAKSLEPERTRRMEAALIEEAAARKARKEAEEKARIEAAERKKREAEERARLRAEEEAAAKAAEEARLQAEAFIAARAAARAAAGAAMIAAAESDAAVLRPNRYGFSPSSPAEASEAAPAPDAVDDAAALDDAMEAAAPAPQADGSDKPSAARAVVAQIAAVAAEAKDPDLADIKVELSEDQW